MPTSIIPIELPTGQLIGPACAYLWPGPPPLLFDCGPRTDAAWLALEAGLAAAGLKPADIDTLVVTHAHANHCGLAARLAAGRTNSALTILGHPAALGALADWPTAWRTRLALFERAALAASVSSAHLAAAMATLTPWEDRAETVESGRLIPLADGQLVTAGGVTWRGLVSPGHAPDHLAMFQRASGTLICGDALLRHVPTLLGLEARGSDGRRPSTLSNLLASWRRLSRLTVEVAYPGHGPPIRAHRLLIARRLADLRLRIATARAAVAAGASTIWNVAGALGHDAERPELLPMALGETVAVLDWLTQRGEIVPQVRAGVVAYAPARSA